MERAAQQAYPSVYFGATPNGTPNHSQTFFQRTPREACNRPLAYALSQLGCSRKFTHPRTKKKARCYGLNSYRALIHGGEGGIRTHGSIAATPDFESGTFDHSATSPRLEANIIAGNLRRPGRNANFDEIGGLRRCWDRGMGREEDRGGASYIPQPPSSPITAMENVVSRLRQALQESRTALLTPTDQGTGQV